MNEKLFSVNEIFGSIEGEGIRTGMLSTFIRLNGCNLRCDYCDTAYALKPEAANMSLQDIMEKVKEIGYPRVTLTGGEPLCHPYVKLLVENLAFSGYEVNIETNGSIPLEDFCFMNGVFVTMDWKCPCSGETSLKSNLKKLTTMDVLKFVVANTADLEEFLEIYKMDLPCTHLVSPVFGEIEPVQIVEFLKEHHCVYAAIQLQIHKIIWEPTTRGV